MPPITNTRSFTCGRPSHQDREFASRLRERAGLVEIASHPRGADTGCFGFQIQDLADYARLPIWIIPADPANLNRIRDSAPSPLFIKNWSLRNVQIKLIKTGARLVRYARRLVFQLAEVTVPRVLFQGVLEHTGRLCPVPG